ncbi:hypothetical protein H1R20_g1138, partial [Candolleomyces eurysporus]
MEFDTMSLDSLFDDQVQSQATKKIASTATVHLNEVQRNTRPSVVSQSAPGRQANGTQTNIEGKNSGYTVSGDIVELDSVSLNGLFDEDVSVTLASPAAKRVDAEGEDEDENVEVIDLTVGGLNKCSLRFADFCQKPPPPPTQKRVLGIDQERKNAQPTRPRSPSLDPFAGLFTPPPERPPARSKRKKKNRVLAFVAIPSLRKGTRKKYKRMSVAFQAPRPPPPPPANNPSSTLQFRAHATLADALAVAHQSNDAALRVQETIVPPPSAKDPPSKAPAPSPPARIPKRKPPKDPDFRPPKRPRTESNATPATKQRPVLADITPKSRPPPRFFYDSKNDCLQLFLTRRELWADALPSEPWIVRPNGQQSDDEYSVGGLWSDLSSSEDEDEDEDGPESEESFGDGEPRGPVAGPSTPPRVDLAEMMRQKTLSAKKPRAEDASPSFPSHKALGKRRADPLPPNPLSPSTVLDPGAFVSQSPYNANQFLHSLPVSPAHRLVGSSGAQQTQSVAIMNVYRNPRASEILLSSLSSPSYPEDTNNPSSGSSSLMGVGAVAHAHPEDDIGSMKDPSPFLTNPDMHLDDLASSYSMTTMEQHHQNPVWGAGLEGDDSGIGGQQEGYCFDTINPTLLQPSGDFVVGTSAARDGEWDAYLADEDGQDDDEQDSRQDDLVVPRSQKQKQKRARSTSFSDLFSSSSSSSSSLDVPLSQKIPSTRQPPKQNRTAPSTHHQLDFGDIPTYESDSNDEDWNGSDGGGLRRGKRKKKKRSAKAYNLDSGESDERRRGRRRP